MELSAKHIEILTALSKSSDYAGMIDNIEVTPERLRAIVHPTGVTLRNANLGQPELVYPAVHIEIREAWGFKRNEDGSFDHEQKLPKGKVEYSVHRLRSAGMGEYGPCMFFDDCFQGETEITDAATDGKHLFDRLVGHAKATCLKLEIENELSA